MKKLVVGLSILTVFFLALGSAASLVPHAHDKYSHHSSESSEKNCPICQIIAHHVDVGFAPVTPPVTINFLVIFACLALVQVFYLNFISTASLRAPPTIS